MRRVLVTDAAVAPGPDNRHPVATTPYEEWTGVRRRMLDVDLLARST